MAGGRMPRKFGCPSGKPRRLEAVGGDAHTGSRCLSASATAAFHPPLASMSGPATSTGLRADSSRLASGDDQRCLLMRAVQIAPTALPTPGAVCRLTWVGLPVACAYPSAIPTTACSWRPSTYVKSSGRLASIGNSVEPGLPKIVVIP
jgi:hypothetical protein